MSPSRRTPSSSTPAHLDLDALRAERLELEFNTLDSSAAAELLLPLNASGVSNDCSRRCRPVEFRRHIRSARCRLRLTVITDRCVAGWRRAYADGCRGLDCRGRSVRL